MEVGVAIGLNVPRWNGRRRCRRRVSPMCGMPVDASSRRRGRGRDRRAETVPLIRGTKGLGQARRRS